MKKFLLKILLLLITLHSVAQDRSKWFEFYLPWNDSSKTVTDMSRFLDAPAGKYGFLQVTPDGHFRFEKKTENERFVSVVNVAISNFPTKEQARIIAARMAKFGINLVRIHLMDVEGQYGLFQNSAQNTVQISSSRLDLMDYFIKCLKDKGIYFNFCIHAGRIYKTADGLDAPVSNDQSKYVTLFNQKIINLQKDFAQKVIGHKNPYTNLTYAEDPTMANLELTNENSLFNGWLGWNADFIFGDAKDGIGSFYSEELDKKFNDWLALNYQNENAIKDAWKGNSTGTVPELALNGSFEQNLTNWSTLITGGAAGSILTDAIQVKHGSKSVKITVTTPGTEYWHVQLKSNNFKVEKAKDYKVSFYAKSDVSKDLRVEFMENSTWKWIDGPSYTTSLSWKKYDLYFNAPFSSDAIIVAFEWGKQSGTFWLDSVSITPFYGIGLEENESLASKNIKRVKNSDIGKFTKTRVGDNARFYFELEKKYTSELSGYLKNTLHVKCPVTFTNNYFGLASIYSQSQADYMDFHMYWDHPSFPNGWSDINFTLKNKSVLLDPANSTFSKMLLTKVRNKPHMLSEYNHPYPYIFQSETPSLLYAYGSFFDLDGITWHAYYDYMNRFSQREQDMFFDIAMHPVMMTQMLLALPYRMKTIKKAQTITEAFYRSKDVFNNTKIFQDNDVVNIENAVMGTSFLKHGFRHSDFEADSTFLTKPLTDPGKVVTSETNELKWDGQQGVFTVNSPYWQGATGYLGGKNIDLNDIIISNVTTTENLNFASVQLISLDSLPIGKSKKMILLTSARLENEGLKWNSTKTSLLSAGGTRALCEPVTAELILKSATPDSLSVYMLNTLGKRNDSLLVTPSGNHSKIIISKNTLWYEISNHKAKTVSTNTKFLDNDKKTMMKIWPNPGKNTSIIEYSFPQFQEAGFFLCNAQGHIIMNEKVYHASGKKRIDTSALVNGLYFYGFKLENGEKIVDKLIILN